jgi:hypothetical protein
MISVEIELTLQQLNGETIFGRDDAVKNLNPNVEDSSESRVDTAQPLKAPPAFIPLIRANISYSGLWKHNHRILYHHDEFRVALIRHLGWMGDELEGPSPSGIL